MKTWKKDELSKKKDAELRKIAKDIGVKKVAGVAKADLIRAILKAQAGEAGKGTAADPKAKPGKKAKKAAKDDDEEEEDEEEEEEQDDEEEDEEEEEEQDDEEEDEESDDEEEQDEEEEEEEEEDEDDEEEEESSNDVSILKGQMKLIVPLLASLARKAGVKLPKEWGKDEEESDEEDEKPAKKGKASPKGKAKKDEEEQEEDDEEETETVRLKASDLATMNISQLRELAEKINNSDIAKAKKVKVDLEGVSSARVARERIKKFAEKYLKAVDTSEKKGGRGKETTPAKGKKGKAKPEEDESDDEEEEGDDEEAEEKPDFVREGAKVEAFFEGEDPEWQPGSVESIDEDEGTAHVVLDDGEEADAPFGSLRAAPKRGKKR